MGHCRDCIHHPTCALHCRSWAALCRDCNHRPHPCVASQVLGTARDCADLAGLAARVGAALRVLGLTHAHVARMGKGGKGGYANEHGTAMRAYGGWTAPRPR